MKKYYYHLIKESAIKSLDELNIDNQFLRFGSPSKSDTDINKEEYRMAIQEGKLLKKIKQGDYVLSLYKTDSRNYDGFITYGEELIGVTQAVNRGYVKNFPQIYYGYVLKEHQGKGLGVTLRQMFVDVIGGVISDSTLTDASLATMIKLGKSNNICIYLSTKEIVPFNLETLKKDEGAVIVVSKTPLI
jgi:hypothetical protein